MALKGRVGESFRGQAVACRRMGSPFTARLCLVLVEGLNPATPVGRRVAEWPGDPVADALPLRLCGGLHALARGGEAPYLTAVYPPRRAAEPELAAAVARAVDGEAAALGRWLDGPPQTNEIGRSGVLLGGLMAVAAETGAGIELLEIGASAGLNLMLDRWAYDLGRGRRWGAANAPLTVPCDWRGEPPPVAPLDVVRRAGVDRSPIDAGEAQARERLLAYVWPDQAGRLARTEAALAHVARHGPRIARAEAPGWLEERLAEPQEARVCRVLMHSIVWQYLTPAEQERITRSMVVAGLEATPERPVAWVRMERDGEPGSAAVLLTTWPGGRTRELGRADFHGRHVTWSGQR